jgi:hypothetical protein
VRSRLTKEFRKRFKQLPGSVQEQAFQAYQIWRADPFHPSLQFKRVSLSQPIYSARVGLGYRALAFRTVNDFDWFWIGPHAEYDKLLRRL